MTSPPATTLECLPVGAVCGTYHHAALYDLIGAAILFGVLWWMLRRRWQAGVMFAVWVGWYGLQRFAIDFTRIGNDMDRMAGPLTWNQWVGLGTGLAAIGWLVWRSRTSNEPAGTEPVSQNAPHN